MESNISNNQKEKLTEMPKYDLNAHFIQLLELARERQKANDIEEQKVILELAYEEAPDNVYVLGDYAMFYINTLEYSKAEELLNTIRKNYYLPKIECLYIKCLNMQNKYKEVDNLLQNYIRLYPDEARYYESWASVLRKRYKYKSACEPIKKAIEIITKKIDKYKNSNNEKEKKIMKSEKKYLLRDEIYLVTLYYYLGDYRNVIKEIEAKYMKYIETINESTEEPIKKLVFFYASSFRNIGDNINYNKYKDIYLKYDENNTEYFYDLALYYLDEDNIEESEKQIDKSLKLKPNFIPSVLRKINFLKNKNQKKEAQELEAKYRKEVEEFQYKERLDINECDKKNATLTSEIPFREELINKNRQRVNEYNEEREINLENTVIDIDNESSSIINNSHKAHNKNNLEQLIESNKELDFAIKIKILKEIAELISGYHENKKLLKKITPYNFTVNLALNEPKVEFIDENVSDDIVNLYKEQGREYTFASEIYSFGMIMLQLLLQVKREEFSKIIGDKLILTSKLAEIKGNNDEKDRKLRQLIVDCKKQDLKIRPTIDKIIETLNAF